LCFQPGVSTPGDDCLKGVSVNIRRIIQWVLAAIGAGICIGVAAAFWRSQSDHLWPIPGLYLIEVAALGVAGFVGLTVRAQAGSGWRIVPWIVTGILLAFVILGAWTIGQPLFPAMLAFLMADILAGLQSKSLIRYLSVLLMAGVVQAGVMLAVIALILRF
jgi:hypothetical protein